MAYEDNRTVLVVDDEEGMRILLSSMLNALGYRVETVGSGESALATFQQGKLPWVVLLDINLPGMDGIEVLRRAMEIQPSQKVIMISCISDVEKVVTAMRLGAVNYLAKPFSMPLLEKALQQCREQAAEESEKSPSGPPPLLTPSPQMQQIRDKIQRIAPSDVPVLILGESGVGKEVVARHVHSSSKRAKQKFVKVNCAALPFELLESELFGYEKGAFTGAAGSKPGKFELAHEGTLFLDEIGEMHPFLQAKLLHVLQDGKYFRLGSNKPTEVDVRIVAATNINVQQAIAEGKLRQDLYYRLNAFSITIPPLRERRDSIPAFTQHFLERYASGQQVTISPELLRCMQEYHWPGNIRELENFVRRVVIFGDDALMLDELRQAMAAAPQRPAPAAPAPQAAAAANGNSAPTGLRDLKRQAEREAIRAALEETQWSRKAAAKKLNISYKALLYKMRDLDLK